MATKLELVPLPMLALVSVFALPFLLELVIRPVDVLQHLVVVVLCSVQSLQRDIELAVLDQVADSQPVAAEPELFARVVQHLHLPTCVQF